MAWCLLNGINNWFALVYNVLTPIVHIVGDGILIVVIARDIDVFLV